MEARTPAGAVVPARMVVAVASATLLNPLNSYSDTFAFGNPFNPGGLRQVTPQRPRTFGVTISAAM